MIKIRRDHILKPHRIPIDLIQLVKPVLGAHFHGKVIEVDPVTFSLSLVPLFPFIPSSSALFSQAPSPFPTVSLPRSLSTNLPARRRVRRVLATCVGLQNGSGERTLLHRRTRFTSLPQRMVRPLCPSVPPEESVPFVPLFCRSSRSGGPGGHQSHYLHRSAPLYADPNPSLARYLRCVHPSK